MRPEVQAVWQFEVEYGQKHTAPNLLTEGRDFGGPLANLAAAGLEWLVALVALGRSEEARQWSASVERVGELALANNSFSDEGVTGDSAAARGLRRSYHERAAARCWEARGWARWIGGAALRPDEFREAAAVIKRLSGGRILHPPCTEPYLYAATGYAWDEVLSFYRASEKRPVALPLRGTGYLNGKTHCLALLALDQLGEPGLADAAKRGVGVWYKRACVDNPADLQLLGTHALHWSLLWWRHYGGEVSPERVIGALRQG